MVSFKIVRRMLSIFTTHFYCIKNTYSEQSFYPCIGELRLSRITFPLGMKSEKFIELLKSHWDKEKLCTESTLTMIDLKSMANFD